MLNEGGHIYAGKHEGWYSVSDETFYPESAVEARIDAETGRKNMVALSICLLRFSYMINSIFLYRFA